ncbi:hypothetical protein GCM10027321_47030 [Massilia terrae]|uniref:DUF5691 domain-containing protein n=1 Tax=Massilia terrae TaxID=1811224 RepID=A0ABT2D5B5_9BURK|nr:DUF5691 domain-containing protein [Massilia terrae]MCS0661225.1 DUF5691 domain-containing protein [Massilia terrae]
MTRTVPELERLLQIGTARARPLLENVVPPSFDMPAIAGTDSSQEQRLWLSLAALDLWQRAGHAPSAAGAHAGGGAPTATGDLAPCPARAESLLGALLQGGQSAALLGEWLGQLYRHGAHLPDRFLVKMLQLATEQKQLRALVRQLLGARGQWTARLEPDWEWAVDGGAVEDRAAIWETGSPSQRKDVLRAWREDDPAAARLALESAWKAEPPESRASLLSCLGVRLQGADEPFLEAALDDRRKEVRMEAQRLLARLPGSALSARMLERLRPLVQVSRPLLRAARLDLTLPQERDAAMVRDGVGANSHPGLGEKAGWVVDMLACVPPEHWQDQFGCGAVDCLALARAGEFDAVFIRGWSGAVQQHLENGSSPQLLSWLSALGALWLDTDPQKRLAFPDAFSRACAALPPDQRYQLLGQLLDTGRAEWQRDPGRYQLLDEAARQSATAWPPELSRKALERAYDALSIVISQANLHWWFVQMIGGLAGAVDPAAGIAIEPALRQRAQGIAVLQDSIDKFTRLVQARHDIYLSFQEQA